MKYIADHDFHIHSQLSHCSNDPLQNNERILQYAKDNGFGHICLTNHYWDENVLGANGWYQTQNYLHISKALPLPQGEEVAFHFGCEVDMDKYFSLGLADQTVEKFDFIVVSTTHLHMTGFTIDQEDTCADRRAELYVKRLDTLLQKDFPKRKIGIAHLVCPHICPQSQGGHLSVIDKISDEVFTELFQKAKAKEFGIELNMKIADYSPEDLIRALRPFHLAKQCGCKFYLGSDAHHPDKFSWIVKNFNEMIELLGLEETDKFLPFG